MLIFEDSQLANIKQNFQGDEVNIHKYLSRGSSQLCVYFVRQVQVQNIKMKNCNITPGRKTRSAYPVPICMKSYYIMSYDRKSLNL